MRTFGRFLGRMLAGLLFVAALLWFLGPYERISLTPTFDSAVIGADIDAYLAKQEARFNDITPGTQKRVIWHETPGEKTPLAIVYVHGFSATSEEIRPVPDNVAAELGANLVFTRLAGHGRGGAALAEATVFDWMTDLAEALEIGRRAGEQVIVIATSTGATLVAETAMQPELTEGVLGVVMISPNFQIADPASAVLTWPAARHWVPLVVGETRSWTPQNEKHETYWTTTYPTVGLFQMAALVKHTSQHDFEKATMPVLFWFSDEDDVVNHAATRDVAQVWGGPVSLTAVTLEDGDDPNNHVIAGDILSPGQGSDTETSILNWINGL